MKNGHEKGVAQNKLKALTVLMLVGLVVFAVFTGTRVWQGHNYANKVSARLATIREQLDQYKQIHGSNPVNSRMAALSTELANNDALATADLDQAKQHGVNVKPLAHEFCELLEDQAKEVKVGNILTPSEDLAVINRNAKLIQNSLTVAMMWE
jgi:type II secretory pathway pseudopilin PulG